MTIRAMRQSGRPLAPVGDHHGVAEHGLRAVIARRGSELVPRLGARRSRRPDPASGLPNAPGASGARRRRPHVGGERIVRREACLRVATVVVAQRLDHRRRHARRAQILRQRHDARERRGIDDLTRAGIRPAPGCTVMCVPAAGDGRRDDARLRLVTCREASLGGDVGTGRRMRAALHDDLRRGPWCGRARRRLRRTSRGRHRARRRRRGQRIAWRWSGRSAAVAASLASASTARSACDRSTPRATSGSITCVSGRFSSRSCVSAAYGGSVCSDAGLLRWGLPR